MYTNIAYMALPQAPFDASGCATARKICNSGAIFSKRYV
jgi:hypothetical protein